MRRILTFLMVAVLAAILLALPLPERDIPAQAPSIPFVWNQDGVWDQLESLFVESRESGCDRTEKEIGSSFNELQGYIQVLESRSISPDSEIWASIEASLFPTAARVAACPSQADTLVELTARLRKEIKQQSVRWDLSSVAARETLYRTMYGSRTAIEEVIVQSGDSSLALLVTDNLWSETPSAIVQGVRIHSGDMLVSRGGYPTSALIARGSDYPGNFSHVALVHVSDSGTVSVIEAHIEVGVTVSTAEAYLDDKKLRLMVLRLRDDLPAVTDDPMLPHKAASYALQRALSGHTPYDFEMNYDDPSKLFCSEVASDAYGELGITLWTGISTISSTGLRRWLAGFGVRYFETQEPSDLEYDPQLTVVAEWRDNQTLLKDRIDNAVVDAMLEGAERGDKLSYPPFELPLGRVAKGYSWVMNLIGKTGPVPEGMSAPSALRNKSYTLRHQDIAFIVTRRADEWYRDNNYQPPYWRLLEFARESINEI